MSLKPLHRDALALPSRRRFVQGLASGGLLAGLGAWPRPGGASAGLPRQPVLAGTDFDLVIGESPVNFTGRTRTAITVNQSLPAQIGRAHV